MVLAAAAEDRGQRAFVGKVSMNIPNDIKYFNTKEKEVAETENFIQLVRNLKVTIYNIYFLIILNVKLNEINMFIYISE